MMPSGSNRNFIDQLPAGVTYYVTPALKSLGHIRRHDFKLHWPTLPESHLVHIHKYPKNVDIRTCVAVAQWVRAHCTRNAEDMDSAPAGRKLFIRSVSFLLILMISTFQLKINTSNLLCSFLGFVICWLHTVGSCKNRAPRFRPPGSPTLLRVLGIGTFYRVGQPEGRGRHAVFAFLHT